MFVFQGARQNPIYRKGGTLAAFTGLSFIGLFAINYRLAKVLVTGLVLAWNYLSRKQLIFDKRKERWKLELSVTFTPRPSKKELIVALQIGSKIRLLVAQVENLTGTKPVTIKGSGPEFVRKVESALQTYVPKKHFVYEVLQIIRWAEKEPA